VEAADPFATLPAPVGGVITLLPNTYYVICGLVNIGPNRIEVPPSSVLAGKDPLVDTLTANIAPVRDLVTLPQGGTVRDLALAWPVRASGVMFGEFGGPPAERCVAWNLSVIGAEFGVRYQGLIGAATIDRLTTTQALRSVYQSQDTESDTSFISFLSVQNVASLDQIAGGTQLRLDGGGEALAMASCFIRAGDPSIQGVFIITNWNTLQFWGCAYFGPGVSSEIQDLATGAIETTGTATQSEAAAMVGYSNSTTRGSISLFGGSLQPNPGAGIYVPIGQGVGGYPLFALSGSSVRCALGGGPTTDLQTLEYIGARPYVADIAVSVTVGTGTGFITASRTFGVRLLKNGVVLPGATWEGGLAPGAIAVTSAAVSFSVPDTLNSGDELKLEIANLTDGAQLVVTGAQIVIS